MNVGELVTALSQYKPETKLIVKKSPPDRLDRQMEEPIVDMVTRMVNYDTVILWVSWDEE